VEAGDDCREPGLERDRPGPRLAGGSGQAAKELDGEILVYGSRRLSRALIGIGLVDELRLLVYPVVLGADEQRLGIEPGAATANAPGPDASDQRSYPRAVVCLSNKQRRAWKRTARC